jgi:hypothetical protein
MDQEAPKPGGKMRVSLRGKITNYSRRGIFDAGGAFAPLKHKKSTCQGKQSMVPEASLRPLTAQPAGAMDF